MMSLTCHSFGEDIQDLQSSGGVCKGNNFVVKGLLNRVVVNLYVLRALMVDGVDNNLDGTNVVNMQWSRVNLREIKLCEDTTQLDDFRAGNNHDTILYLNRGLKYTILLLVFIRDKSINKK